MNPELYQKIINSSTSRESRNQNAKFVLQNPQLFSDLLQLTFDAGDKNHVKASWILQLVLEEKLELLFPFLEQFCQSCQTIKDESTMRSIAKIIMLLSQEYERNPDILSAEQTQVLIEFAFDKIIDHKTKVASKAYSIRALYHLGTQIPWIYCELKPLLNKDYENYSAAYKAVAREILKKLQ